MTKRKDNTQLAYNDEFQSMLQQEGKRNPIKLSHFPSFNTISIWLSTIGITTDYFSKDNFSLDHYSQEHTEELKNEVEVKTLEHKNKMHEVSTQITNYLGEEDPPEPSDIIFVYGGKGETRIAKAVELYKHQLAPHILTSGKSPHYIEAEQSEASRFAEYAIKQGIPETALILEHESINIVDNIKRGLNLLEAQNIKHNKIIQVISWYAQRRAWASMMKYTQNGTTIYRVNSVIHPDNQYISKEHWYENPRGIQIVLNEFIKMKIAVTLNSA